MLCRPKSVRSPPVYDPQSFQQKAKLVLLRPPAISRGIFTKEVMNSAWYNQGWVFQERTLSPRLLIFGKTQTLWACHKLQAAETWPCGKTSDNFIDHFESLEVEESRLRELLNKTRVISTYDKTRGHSHPRLYSLKIDQDV